MRKNVLLLGALGVLLLIVGLLLWGIYLMTPQQYQELDYHVKVGDYMGFNIDTDKMYFGTVSPGLFSQRKTSLCSEKSVLINIQPTGMAQEWIDVSNNHLVLDAGECQEVEFTLRAPKNTTHGTYTGTITFTMYPPLARFLI